MRPTSRELVDAVAEALDAQVLPFVGDKWAASTLRSAIVLLRHAALRIELEPAMRARHAQELRDCLAPFGVPAAVSDFDALQAAAERVLAERARSGEASRHDAAHHDRLVACLTRQLDEYREILAPFEGAPPI